VTAARKASDGPVLAEAGPAITGRPDTTADRVAEPAGRPAAAAGGPAVAPSAPSAGGDGPGRSATGVLADRMASALVHHEPGWRLPRHSALARRYNVSTAEVDAAVGELAARRLVRRLPDGQLYRSSPAEYLVPLAGTPGLSSHIDPMGREIACRSRQVSWRRVPEDIGWALGVTPGDSACVIRLLWTADGEPAALATTYLARHLAGQPAGQGEDPLAVPAALAAWPLFAGPGAGDQAVRGGPAGPEDATAQAGRPGTGNVAGRGQRAATDAEAATADETAPAGPDEAGTAAAEPGGACQPSALFVELQPPPPAVARSLRLSAGQPAVMVSVRFDDPAQGRPAALTVAVLRPDMFRIVIESPASPLPGGTAGSFSGAWTYALRDWEP
jgi:DNA-binding GntR family transcriptional regulator